jgi:hypothetical protein
MRNARLATIASIPVLGIVVALTPAATLAGDYIHHGWQSHDLWATAPGPSPAADPSSGIVAGLPPTAWCYQAPILAVYQFPAVMANQPGSPVAYLWTDPTCALLGGQPYLYHP